MFDVQDKNGNIRKVYAVERYLFLVNENGEFVWKYKSEFSPVPELKKLDVEADENKEISENGEVVLTYTQQETVTLKKYIEGLQNGSIQLAVGDSFSIRLKDDTEVDFVVTDMDDTSYRFESRDCLGRHVPMTKIEEFFEEVWDLLPEALRDSIMDTERPYKTHKGKLKKKTCKLFLPSAAEIFPPEECYGDKEVYQQMDWYKTVHNRVRAAAKGVGDGGWYWTQSAYSGKSPVWCFVNYGGNAGNYYASYVNVAAPVCFRIPRF